MQVTISVDTSRIRKLSLDDRGRVTIPKDLREDLDLEEGDEVEVAVDPDPGE